LTRLAVISFAFLVATAGGAARAEDLPIPVKTPVASPQSWSWTGFYIGGHLGGAYEFSKLNDPFGPVSFGDSVTTAAVIGGGQVGANYQIGHVVVGASADLSWVASRGDETCFGLLGGNFFASNCSVDPTLFSTFTARLGYAFGHTLLYAKGGAAWEHTNVDITVNNNPGQHFLSSATGYGEWGWTAGGGIEYALSPAWSVLLEYDFLGFGAANVATPYVAGNPLPGHPVGPIAGLSSDVSEVKLGVNYKIGADPSQWPANTVMLPTLWSAPAMSFLPLKAPPQPVAAGWEIEAGARYMFSSGREQWGQAFAATPTWFSSSKLTWSDLNTNSAELFGRVDSPWNIFLNGFIGVGSTFSGGQTDEDFNEPPPDKAYNNTFSTNNGSISYAVADIGYDVLRNANYKVGPFVGYTRFNQYIFKSGCQQIASTTGNCVIGGASAPLPSSQLIGSEDMAWQALRVGVSGQVSLTDRLKLSADAAYLPYVTFSWLDDHLDRDLQSQMTGQGIGVQTQAVLSYDVTDRLSVGVGARYWAMWSTSAERQSIPVGGLTSGPNRNSIDLAGLFVQTSYRFAPNSALIGPPRLFDWAPTLKMPAPSQTYDWTGLYGGVEGGGVFGQSKQIGQLPGTRFTADSTPSFNVDGGLVGGTLGFNAQFYRILVYGLEGDMSWVTAGGSARQIAPFALSETGVTTQDWLGTARVRIGVTPANGWLVYGTGGLAVADVGASVTGDFSAEYHVRPGWTAGGGIEATIVGNWSAKLEYLYVGLEDVGYFVPSPNDPARSNRAGGVPLNESIVRGGINYRISWL
jgi:opacity protein-like surface antigen